MTTEIRLLGGTVFEIRDHLNGVREVASSNLAVPTTAQYYQERMGTFERWLAANGHRDLN